MKHGRSVKLRINEIVEQRGEKHAYQEGHGDEPAQLPTAEQIQAADQNHQALRGTQCPEIFTQKQAHGFDIGNGRSAEVFQFAQGFHEIPVQEHPVQIHEIRPGNGQNRPSHSRSADRTPTVSPEHHAPKDDGERRPNNHHPPGGCGWKQKGEQKAVHQGAEVVRGRGLVHELLNCSFRDDCRKTCPGHDFHSVVPEAVHGHGRSRQKSQQGMKHGLLKRLPAMPKRSRGHCVHAFRDFLACHVLLSFLVRD